MQVDDSSRDDQDRLDGVPVDTRSAPQGGTSGLAMLVIEHDERSSVVVNVGFTILALSWMVKAVGHRRLARELPA